MSVFTFALQRRPRSAAFYGNRSPWEQRLGPESRRCKDAAEAARVRRIAEAATAAMKLDEDEPLAPGKRS